MQRYFVDNKDLILRDSDVHHIKNVMRMKIGEEIEIVNEKQAYLARIDNLDPIKISIVRSIEEASELDIDITIAIGLVKEQKMDLILQKLTELGVKKIIPIKMERSIINFDDKKKDKKLVRWESICKEASEQSHRLLIPEVTEPISLKELVKIEADVKIVASTKEVKNLINNYLQTNKKCAKMVVVIGPEGGITDNEEEFLNNNGFVSVTLGKRILRVETAAIYIASVLNYQYMK